MAHVGIVTDSASDLTDEEVTSLGIEVVPLSIRFGDEEFEDRTEPGRQRDVEIVATVHQQL